MATISVIEAVSPAIEHTRRILFQPFHLGKWFLMGFCAFLSSCAGGGVSGGGVPGANFQMPFSPAGGPPAGPPKPPQQLIRDGIREWLPAEVAVAVAVVASVVLLALLLWVLMLWLGSRGHFMLLDGVVRNRGAVREPWHEFAREGNSLFVFFVVFNVLAWCLMAAVIGGGVALAWPDLQAGRFGSSAILALVVTVPLLGILGMLSLFLTFIVDDFLVPLMYRSRSTVLESWAEFQTLFLVDHKLTLLAYVFFRFILTMGIGMAAGIATICTCFLAAFPYLGAVILLPLAVFLRTYPLCVLEQFGPEWRVFPSDPLPEEPTFM